jgi:hypothetical protein
MSNVALIIIASCAIFAVEFSLVFWYCVHWNWLPRASIERRTAAAIFITAVAAAPFAQYCLVGYATLPISRGDVALLLTAIHGIGVVGIIAHYSVRRRNA